MTTDRKKALVLKNHMIEPLILWLQQLALPGKESRERTRFLNLLIERYKEINEVRKGIQEKYGEKDKDGKLKRDKNGDVVLKDLKKAEEEYREYIEEDFVIDLLEGNKSKVYTVADIVLNTEERFEGPNAGQYERWCECFEALPNRHDV